MPVQKTSSQPEVASENRGKPSVNNPSDGNYAGKTVASASKRISDTTKKSKRRSKNKEDTRSLLRRIFEDGGFRHIESDTIEVTFEERACDIDHIFSFQNLLVFCEETQGQASLSSHFTTKDFFHEIVKSKPEEFLSVYRKVNSDFDSFLTSTGLNDDDFVFRQIYLSEKKPLDDGLLKNKKALSVLSPSEAKYFSTLTKTIGKSARYELLKYLGVSLSDLAAKIQGRPQTVTHSFDAFA